MACRPGQEWSNGRGDPDDKDFKVTAVQTWTFNHCNGYDRELTNGPGECYARLTSPPHGTAEPALLMNVAPFPDDWYRASKTRLGCRTAGTYTIRARLGVPDLQPGQWVSMTVHAGWQSRSHVHRHNNSHYAQPFLAWSDVELAKDELVYVECSSPQPIGKDSYLEIQRAE